MKNDNSIKNVLDKILIPLSFGKLNNEYRLKYRDYYLVISYYEDIKVNNFIIDYKCLFPFIPNKENREGTYFYYDSDDVNILNDQDDIYNRIERSIIFFREDCSCLSSIEICIKNKAFIKHEKNREVFNFFGYQKISCINSKAIKLSTSAFDKYKKMKLVEIKKNIKQLNNFSPTLHNSKIKEYKIDIINNRIFLTISKNKKDINLIFNDVSTFLSYDENNEVINTKDNLYLNEINLFKKYVDINIVSSISGKKNNLSYHDGFGNMTILISNSKLVIMVRVIIINGKEYELYFR